MLIFSSCFIVYGGGWEEEGAKAVKSTEPAVTKNFPEIFFWFIFSEKKPGSFKVKKKNLFCHFWSIVYLFFIFYVVNP